MDKRFIRNTTGAFLWHTQLIKDTVNCMWLILAHSKDDFKWIIIVSIYFIQYMGRLMHIIYESIRNLGFCLWTKY